jgi:hypothetical protein
MSLDRGLLFHGVLIPLLRLLDDHAHRSDGRKAMLEIAGGILIAVGILAVLVAFPTAVMLLVSGSFCLGLAAVAWYFLASQVGQTWATAAVLAGITFCAIPAIIASLAEARAVAELKNSTPVFGRRKS